MKDRIQGKWHKVYSGTIKNPNTGKNMKVYQCTCLICGWKTGNQGTKFNYCPMCGTKMEQ